MNPFHVSSRPFPATGQYGDLPASGSPEREVVSHLTAFLGEDGSCGANPILSSGCKVLSVFGLQLLWLFQKGEPVYFIKCCHFLDLPQRPTHSCVNTQPIQNHWPSSKSKSPTIGHQLVI